MDRGLKDTEPTPREWLIARAVHQSLEGCGLSDEQRHMVRVTVIGELIKARQLEVVHACKPRDAPGG